MVDGRAKSTVPSLSFWSRISSLPSWLDPKTTTLALPASLSLATRANSSAHAATRESGAATWASFSSRTASSALPPLQAASKLTSKKLKTWRTTEDDGFGRLFRIFQGALNSLL